MNIEKFLEIAKSNGMQVEYKEKGNGGYIETFNDPERVPIVKIFIKNPHLGGR